VARARHVGCRVTPVLLNRPERSVVLRTVWRIKDDNYYVDPTGQHHVVSTNPKQRKAFEQWVGEQGWPKPEYTHGMGSGTNARPDYQQLLSPVELVLWLDSSEESAAGDRLEVRVERALTQPATVDRFGGLSLGESSHLVDSVKRFAPDPDRRGRAFLLAERGRLTLPVWVDHVGSAGTRHVTGDLIEVPLTPPPVEQLPRIQPLETPP
jgi:CRISPR-associated protein Cas5t